ncbi:MAG: 3-phosphoshikimate 1-carboxyvinyltransferase [Ruminococcaceae bacterium]|nr:3-phosphoshikimate 1-carboxyvinyltransferase [Oscillospiraceae bacterium]
MQVTVLPSKARGQISAPPSKSMAHRLLISAGLATGTSQIFGISRCEDVLATVDCLRALGADCRVNGDCVTVTGMDASTAQPKVPLVCRESGSTLRFMIPIALLSGEKVTLQGAPSLLARPMGVYETLCREQGLAFSQEKAGITVKGPLTGGIYTLPGNVSSQFISGMLFALPLCGEDSEIRLTPPVESRSYVDLTLSALRAFGIVAEWRDDTTLSVPGGQTYLPQNITVEGDYSNAAFLDALGLLGGNVRVDGLLENSLQGDRVYKKHFAALQSGHPTISLADCPDLGPILFSLAAALNGAVFTDTQRLRIKESDRVACMKEELEKFGARLLIGDNTVTVEKTPLHAPTQPLYGHNDHRIVMSMAVLATRFGGTILGAEAVAKSFPDFFDRLQMLDVRVQIENDR